MNNVGKPCGRRIVGFTAMVGDLLHAGHIAMLRECRKYCNYLIVCVMAKAGRQKHKPVQSLFERCWQVKHTVGVDESYCCESEEDLLLAIKVMRPFVDIHFAGDDYIGKNFTGKQYCEESGLRIMYNRRDHGLASSELRMRITKGRRHESLAI